MRNANRDYFITLNAKNSTVTAGNLSFYITDKNTSNIFCQLIFNESNNQLINSYAPNENAEDYIITLRIVKPNNEPKEIRFSILSAPNFVYYVDLTDDYKDIIGTYECECFIDSTINGRLERNTTNSFTYTVKESIMSELDGLLEDLPSFPLIDNLATRDYVDKAIANGVDLTSFVTRTELHDQLDAYEFLPTIGDGTDWHIFTVDDAPELYDEKTYLLNKVRIEGAASNKDFYNEVVRIYSGPYTITGIDTSISSKMLLMVTSNSSMICIPRPDGKFDITENNFVIEQRMNEALANKADNNHTHSGLHTHSNKDILDGITAEKVASWDSSTGSSVDLSGYVTTEAMNTALSGKSNTNHTHSNYATSNNPNFTGTIKGDNCKVAIGSYVSATGNCSYAQGENVYARGNYSCAQGEYVETTGKCSYAQGLGFEFYDDTTESYDEVYTTASGTASHAEGYGTQANGNYQHVQGKLNIPDTSNRYAHIVGNGTDEINTSNAHTLDWDGNGWYAGNLYVGGTSQDNANKVLSTADIKFTADGKLSVTINGVTKKFTPDA